MSNKKEIEKCAIEIFIATLRKNEARYFSDKLPAIKHRLKGQKRSSTYMKRQNVDVEKNVQALGDLDNLIHHALRRI